MLLASRIANRTLDSLTSNFGATWRHLVADSQLRWVGPEKGVLHLALGAVVNAIWDLWGKVLGKPVWQIVADMAPEEVVRCIDFRYLRDAITEEEAVKLLAEAQDGKRERLEKVWESTAVRAYTTSAGWLGYGEEKVRSGLEDAVKEGYRNFKMKVGGGLEADKRRLRIAREVIGWGDDMTLMVDANQVSPISPYPLVLTCPLFHIILIARPTRRLE